MARFNLRDVVQAISIENTDQGVYLTGDDGAEFRKFPSEATPPVFPTRNNVEDNAVGDGRAYKKQSKPYYFNPISYPQGMALNTTMGVRIFRNWLGGAVTQTDNLVFLSTDHAIKQMAPGEVPMCCNILRSLGGESNLYGDVFVQTIEMSQSGAGEPRISASLQNSGHFEKIADTSIDLADVDDLAAYLKMHGTKTKLTFSDGVSSYDFAAEHRLIDVSFSGNQNVIVEPLPGDSFQNPDNECHGAFADSFFIDIQSAMIRAKVYMDEDFAQFDSWLPNRKLTSVKLTFSTCEIVGATTHHFEIEVEFPIAQFNLEPDQNSNFSAFSFNIEAIEGDPTTGCLVLGRVRRATADGPLDEVVV